MFLLVGIWVEKDTDRLIVTDRIHTHARAYTREYMYVNVRERKRLNFNAHTHFALQESVSVNSRTDVPLLGMVCWDPQAQTKGEKVLYYHSFRLKQWGSKPNFQVYNFA